MAGTLKITLQHTTAAREASGLKFTPKVETWQRKTGASLKIAVRDQYGRFHGATNYDPR